MFIIPLRTVSSGLDRTDEQLCIVLYLFWLKTVHALKQGKTLQFCNRTNWKLNLGVGNIDALWHMIGWCTLNGEEKFAKSPHLLFPWKTQSWQLQFFQIIVGFSIVDVYLANKYSTLPRPALRDCTIETVHLLRRRGLGTSGTHCHCLLLLEASAFVSGVCANRAWVASFTRAVDQVQVCIWSMQNRSTVTGFKTAKEKLFFIWLQGFHGRRCYCLHQDNALLPDGRSAPYRDMFGTWRVHFSLKINTVIVVDRRHRVMNIKSLTGESVDVGRSH